MKIIVQNLQQIKNEVKLSKSFVKKYLSKEIIKNIFLKKEKINNVKEVKILNLWVSDNLRVNIIQSIIIKEIFQELVILNYLKGMTINND